LTNLTTAINHFAPLEPHPWHDHHPCNNQQYLIRQLPAQTCPGSLSGSKLDEGLPGMNFLKNFRYYVNFDQQVIKWGG